MQGHNLNANGGTKMKSGELNRATCEKQFIVNALQHGIRQDGRQFYDFRELSISYGESFGHCEVCIGNTRALAQVSCEIVKPSKSRPNEGRLFLNVELSPMASQAFESGRPSSQAIEINQFVERCFRESRAIDMESLCIIAGEKVWCLRVDIHILDDKGNILDCACVAAISALAHFRRPDVTVSGKDITIHSFDDKDAIPLSVHHIPICISLGFVNSCDKPIVDPTEIEELAVDGFMMVALNSYMEICCSKMCGIAISPEKVMMCCKIASSKVKEITDKMKNSLEKDSRKRFPNKDQTKKWRIDEKSENNILKSVTESTQIDITKTVREAVENSNKINIESPVTTSVVRKKDKKTTTIGEGGSNVWIISDDETIDDTDDQMNGGNEVIEKANNKPVKRVENTIDYINIDDDSEEEETIQLTNMDLDFQTITDPTSNKDTFDEDIKIIENKPETPLQKLKTRKRKKKKTATVS